MLKTQKALVAQIPPDRESKVVFGNKRIMLLFERMSSVEIFCFVLYSQDGFCDTPAVFALSVVEDFRRGLSMCMALFRILALRVLEKAYSSSRVSTSASHSSQ